MICFWSSFLQEGNRFIEEEIGFLLAIGVKKGSLMKKEKTLLENIRWFYFFCVGLVGYSCRGVIIILGAYEKKRS